MFIDTHDLRRNEARFNIAKYRAAEQSRIHFHSHKSRVTFVATELSRHSNPRKGL